MSGRSPTGCSGGGGCMRVLWGRWWWQRRRNGSRVHRYGTSRQGNPSHQPLSLHKLHRRSCQRQSADLSLTLPQCASSGQDCQASSRPDSTPRHPRRRSETRSTGKSCRTALQTCTQNLRRRWKARPIQTPELRYLPSSRATPILRRENRAAPSESPQNMEIGK